MGAGKALQRLQQMPHAPRTLWLPKQDILNAGEKWGAAGAGGASEVAKRPLETAVFALRQLLVAQGVPLDNWEGCELWVRRQVMGAGVTTHYDLDIGRKRHEHTEHVPYLSSILYLPTSTQPDAPAAPFSAGPTFILDSRHDRQPRHAEGAAASTSPPTRADFVWPRAGRYAIFDGQVCARACACVSGACVVRVRMHVHAGACWGMLGYAAACDCALVLRWQRTGRKLMAQAQCAPSSPHVPCLTLPTAAGTWGAALRCRPPPTGPTCHGGRQRAIHHVSQLVAPCQTRCPRMQVQGRLLFQTLAQVRACVCVCVFVCVYVCIHIHIYTYI